MADQGGFLGRIVTVLSSCLDLDDERLDKRAVEMAQACLGSAKSSVSALSGRSEAEEKAAQRLLSNDRVKLLALREALYGLSFAEVNSRGVQRVVVAFDPTYLDFSSQKRKKDRRSIGNGGGEGYVWLNCAMFDPEGRLLGVAHQTLVHADGPDDANELDYAPGIRRRKLRAELAANHKQQFLTHAQAVDRRAPPGLELVFVADREFDDGLVLRAAGALSPRCSFVIRSNESRGVQVRQAPWIPGNRKVPSRNNRLPSGDDEALAEIYLKDIVQALPLPIERDLPLDSRGRLLRGQGKPARVAHLSIGAVAIRLMCSSKRARRVGIDEQPTWLNLVVVRELNPPDGIEPLCWVLLTSLPIDTPEQILFVVACYACRWRTEEFFRTTKDGMELERSRLDDATSTARLLFFVTLRAMFLDALRAEAELPAGVPLTDEQRGELRAAPVRCEQIEKNCQAGQPPPPLSPRERARLLIGRAARLGRWVGRRGNSLGNYVLLRGLAFLLHDFAEGRYLWLIQGAEDVGS